MRTGVLSHSDFYSYLFFLTHLFLLSNYFLPSLVRISSKIVKTNSILGQGPRKKYKEDKETRKVEIGRLGGEERDPKVLLPKEVLRVRILKETSLKELVSRSKPCVDYHWRANTWACGGGSVGVLE